MNTEDKGVFFESENPINPLIGQTQAASSMVKFVINLSGGLVSSEKQANFVLIGFVVIAVIFSYLLTVGPPTNPPTLIKNREDISPEVRSKLPPGVWATIPAKFK